MDNSSFFVDRTGATPPPIALWPSVVIPKEAIDAEIERLSTLPKPADGLRRALIVHPNSREPGLGLAPGIRVSLDVLLPGESTAPVRHNSSQVNFCIQGSGSANVGSGTSSGSCASSRSRARPRCNEALIAGMLVPVTSPISSKE